MLAWYFGSICARRRVPRFGACAHAQDMNQDGMAIQCTPQTSATSYSTFIFVSCAVVAAQVDGWRLHDEILYRLAQAKFFVPMLLTPVL